MRTWTTTSWSYRTFGQTHTDEKSDTVRWNQGIWKYNYYRPDYNKLEAALNELTTYCNKNQFAVKAIIPLTMAQTFEYGQTSEWTASILHGGGVVTAAGIGQGWGYSNVIGFAALLEKVETISEEEYQRRISADENTPSLVPA
jgi:hypothetical protein